jgi:hypothetical protein
MKSLQPVSERTRHPKEWQAPASPHLNDPRYAADCPRQDGKREGPKDPRDIVRQRGAHLSRGTQGDQRRQAQLGATRMNSLAGQQCAQQDGGRYPREVQRFRRRPLVLAFSLRRHRVHLVRREHDVIDVHVAAAEAPWLQPGGTHGAHGLA